MNSKIFISGATGFIGGNLKNYFTNKNFHVFTIEGAAFKLNSIVKIIDQDASAHYLADLASILSQYTPDFFVHCAGTASVSASFENPKQEFYSNVVLTKEILHAILKNSPQTKFVFLSSAAVYGNPVALPVLESHSSNPISPYGFSKLQTELICKEYSNLYNLNTVILRIFSVYGRGLRKQLFWDVYQKSLTSNTLELYGTGNETRDFIFIDDVISAIHCVFKESKFNADIVNIASGTEISVKLVTEKFVKMIHPDKKIIFNNIVKEGDPKNWRSDISKLKSYGFKQDVSLDKGLKNYLEWVIKEKK